MYSTEQKVITVANNDTDINTAIASQVGWLVISLTLFNSDASVIILFSRTTVSS